MLKLMYITNRPAVARIAENAGVDRIFVDMEYIGKDKRAFTFSNGDPCEDSIFFEKIIKAT